MLVQSAYLGTPSTLFELTTVICCEPEAESVRLNVILQQPEPSGIFNFGDKESERRAIQLQIEPRTWTEVDAPKRSNFDQTVVEEFLADLPQSNRRVLCEQAEIRRVEYCQLKGRSLSPETYLAGDLVYWSELAEENQLPNTPLDEFSHHGATYLALDCYCVNPNCDCKEAHLAFHRVDLDGMSADNLCLATLPFVGKIRVVDIVGDRTEAWSVVSAWQAKRSPFFLPELKWRYGHLRASAAKGLNERFAARRKKRRAAAAGKRARRR